MLDHLQRPSSGKASGRSSRSAGGPGGEGGNWTTRPGPNTLLVAALLFSAVFIALATAALR